MPSAFNPDQPLHGRLEEKYISFNFRRSSDNYRKAQREVVLLNPLQPGNIVIPGIKKKNESALVEELKKYQNWNTAIKHSFEISPYLFSFLWRFKTPKKFGLNKFGALAPIDKKVAKKIKTAFNKYQVSLRSKLSPGQVYLFPDADVIFQRPNRFKQVYARRVLVIDVRADQLVIIPFSSRVDRIDKKTDILFDSGFKGERLDPDAMPGVENFPYKIFSRKVALFVCAAQPITEKDFLEAALIAKGAIRKDVLDFVREKMKNI